MDTQQLQTQGNECPIMEDTSIAHLAGVLDATGTVTVQINKNENYKIDYQLQLIVRIIRPTEDDPLLGKLMAYCDEQGVKFSISEKSHGAERDTVSYEFLVKRPESVKRFLEPMVPYLVTKYEPVLIVLEEMIPRIEDGIHLEREGFYELMEYADLIRQKNRRGGERKYTQKYFEREWSITE